MCPRTCGWSSEWVNSVTPWLMAQEKAESAVKVAASDAAALSLQADGDPESASPGGGKDSLGVGADLDAYIKNLLNTPAPGEEVTEEQHPPTSPAGKYVMAYVDT